MRSRRFDTQLQYFFMVLSGLMVVVGLASIGVNRFLAQTQQRVLAESIDIIERAERVAQDADFIASLAGQLAEARGADQVDDLSLALEGRMDRIATDLAATRRFLGKTAGPDLVEGVRGLAGGLDETVHSRIAADAALATERADLTHAGARLAALISTEADLARLRITAGIWELYILPDSADARAGLDRLADVNFFAYERLTEMARAAAAFGRMGDRILEAETTAELDELALEYAAAIELVRDRAQFMLSRRSRDETLDIVRRFALGPDRGGLPALRRAALETGMKLDALSGQLHQQTDLLTREARQGRSETRLLMQAGVAAAGRDATLLSAALAALILLAMFMGYVVWARTRGRVVLRLEDVAERMVAVAGGDLGRAMPISGTDEIGRLEQALNVLRERTEEALKLRERLEAAVFDRTAEVVAEMQSANAARADAEEQSRAKTHFLARMSHEIRTPLNGLIGMLDLLAADEAGATRRARLDVALTSARDLQELTEDVLAFSVGEEGHDKTGQAVFDPATLAHGLAAHLAVIALEKGLVADVDIDPGLPPALFGEPAKIRQVLMNLLSNAVKYTVRGSVELAVTSRPAGERQQEVSLAVRDTGPGMTAEETRQAFDIYGRSRSARQSGVKGVGLGLAIVRQLTDAMGGELRVITEPGRGSGFTLVLRLPEANPADLPLAQPLPAEAAGGRVLVVDDHPVNRLVARGYLERMGCSVTEAATGEAALAAAQDGKFDAILVDLGLPDMGGDEVVARLARKGAKVAIVTADLVSDDAGTLGRYGVDRMMTKPLSPRTLADFLAGGRTSAVPGAVDGDAVSTVEAALRADVAGIGAEQTADIVWALLEELAGAVSLFEAAPDLVARQKLAHRLKGAAANFRLESFCGLMQRVQSGDLAALDQLDSVASAAICGLADAARRAGLVVQPAAAAVKK
jgi:two-component system sensor histidine kinase TorS